MQEFKVNEFITLKLEDKRTVIYVAGEEFAQCKYLFLNILTDEIELFDEIDSIDEAAEKLDKSMEGGLARLYIPPETEFWGHCSNLQAWAELNYDTRILHSNLSFPLLRKLTEAGDPLAKKIFKEDIAERFLSGHKKVMTYLADCGYLDYFNEEELKSLFERFEESPDKLLDAADFDSLDLKILTSEYPISFIKKLLEQLPLEQRTELIYHIGRYVAKVKLKPMPFETVIQIQRSKELKLDLKNQVLELALEYPEWAKILFELLAQFYYNKNSWDKTISFYEKSIEQRAKPKYITNIFIAALYLSRHDIIDKYLKHSIKLVIEEESFLKNQNLLSIILYALNKKETKKSSEIALNLVKTYWDLVRHRFLDYIGKRFIMPDIPPPGSWGYLHVIPSLWVNMTNAFKVANIINPSCNDIFYEVENRLEDMPPKIYENLAWHSMKNEFLDEAIFYLKEAKIKGHLEFNAIKDSKYFKPLRDNPECLKLFE